LVPALAIPLLSDTSVYNLAVTVFYAGVVMAQIGNAFACRAELNRSYTLGYFSNRILWAGILVSVLQLLAVVYISGLRDMFQHFPLPLFFWVWVLPYGLYLYGLEWVRKAFMRRNTPEVEPIH
jgi:P-type Ca2+ transporter type 2C